MALGTGVLTRDPRWLVRFFLVLFGFALGLANVVGLGGTAIATGADVPAGNELQVYDGPAHVYDTASHSARVHTSEVALGASRHASEGVQGSVVTATGPLAVLFAKLVAANTAIPIAEQNVTNSGKTVLGSYPRYIEVAQSRGASYFDIGDAWNGLSASERTAANNLFLDGRMAAGDQFYVTTPSGLINPGSQLADEVAYMTRPGSGYQWVNQWSLKPGG